VAQSSIVERHAPRIITSDDRTEARISSVDRRRRRGSREEARVAQNHQQLVNEEVEVEQIDPGLVSAHMRRV
jgi:hypothetical protein